MLSDTYSDYITIVSSMKGAVNKLRNDHAQQKIFRKDYNRLSREQKYQVIDRCPTRFFLLEMGQPKDFQKLVARPPCILTAHHE